MPIRAKPTVSDTELQGPTSCQSRETSRFTRTTEYTKAPRVTRERMYLEAVEKFLPSTRKVIMDGPNSKLIPLLTLPAGKDGLGIVPPALGESAAPSEKKGK